MEEPHEHRIRGHNEDVLAASHHRGADPDPGVVRGQRAHRLDGRHHHRSEHRRHEHRHRDHRGHLLDGGVHPARRQDRLAIRLEGGVPDRPAHPRRGDARHRARADRRSALHLAGRIRCRHRLDRARAHRLHRHQLQGQSAGCRDRPARRGHPRGRCSRPPARRDLRDDDRMALVVRADGRARRRQLPAEPHAQEGEGAAAAADRLDRGDHRRRVDHPPQLRLLRTRAVGARDGVRGCAVHDPGPLARTRADRARSDRRPALLRGSVDARMRRGRASSTCGCCAPTPS